MAQRAGDICAEVIVPGDVGGQLAPGSNLIRMRVDGVLGNTVSVMAPGAGPQLAARQHPVRLLPRCPEPFFDREDETQQVLAELVARRSVALEAPPGMGMSTLVQHLAHEPIVTAIYGGVVCLSARGQTLDDLLQSLFTAFYTSDAPVRPTREQLRHLLRPVHAAVFLDDVELPKGALAELQELAPHCSFVLGGARTGEVRSVALAGLHVDAAGQLLTHVLGHPVDRSAVYALWGLARGAPTGLIQLGAGAATYRGPLAEYVAMALQDALPPFTVSAPEDHRLLGLLAAVPGLELDAQQLGAIAAVPDAAGRLRPWVECGLVTALDSGTYRFAGGELDPMVWQLAERRAELVAAFATWARRHPEAVLDAGGRAEPFRVLQQLARRQDAWRAVLAMGALLDVAYARAGRWDAWHSCLQAMLEAARALGDQGAEALALHQLGTHALGRGDLATARKLLGAALDLRLALGQTAAATVTRRNLATITDRQPAPARRGFAGTLARIPTAAKVAAVLIPLLGSLAFVGLAQAGATPSASLSPQRLTFADQAVDKASAPQIIHLGNGGKTALHVENVALGGPNHGAFTLVDTSCVGMVVAGSECTATVVFTPAAPGAQQANIAWRIREIPDDVSSPLVGVGVAATASGPVVAPAPAPAPAPVVVAAPAPIVVPVLVGQSQATATARLNAIGLRVGQVARRSDPKIAAGLVVACNPQPGAQLPRGSTVGLVVSSGPPVVTAAVPSVVGRSLTNARSLITAQKLVVGAVITQPSSTVAKGLVISSNPGAGARLVTGSRVSLVVSSGPAVTTVTVPNVVGVSSAGAQAQITNAKLVVGPVTNQPSSTVAEGVVISSSPSAGVQATSGSRVSLVVSSGPAVTDVTVPNVVGRSSASAQSLISGQNLAVGSVTTQPSSTVAKGVVISSSPAAGERVASSSRVSLVVSSGPEVTTATVPDLAGKSLANAQAAITSQYLVVGAVTTVPSSSVAKGVVIRSNPGAGEQVASGARVSLVVSSGPAVTKVAVPDVTGSSLAEARSLVADAKLVVGVVKQQASASVPAGQVIRSNPGAGAQVLAGAPVSLVVSSGAPRTVPSVVGLSLAQATAKLQAAGLRVVAVDANGDPVKSGTVVSVDPGAGEPAPVTGRVELTVQPPAQQSVRQTQVGDGG